MLDPAADLARTILQRIVNVRPCAFQCGGEATDDGGQQRHDNGERQDEIAERRLTVLRQIDRADRNQQVQAPSRDQQSGRSASETKDQRFGEQLTNDPASCGAERRADGDFTLSGRAARQQQVRHVRTRDQKHERHRARQHHQGRTQFARKFIAQRDDVRRPAGVELGKLRRETCRDRLHFTARLIDGHARLQPRDDRNAAASWSTRRFGKRKIPPQIGWLSDLRVRFEEQPDVGGHDPDDGRRVAVQDDRPADDRRVGGELARPERMTQDGRIQVRIGQFGVRKRSSVQRRHAEHREQRANRQLMRDLDGIARSGQHASAIDEGGHLCERRGALLPTYVIARTNDVATARPASVFLPDCDEPRWIFERQTFDEHRVHQREDRGIGADAEPERQDCDRCEPWRANERADSVANILGESIHEGLDRLAGRFG